MKEPVRPFEPYKKDFLDKKIEHYLFYKYYYNDDCADEEELLHNLEDGFRGLKGQKLQGADLRLMSYDNRVCSLAELLEKIPSGVDPKDVTINIHRERMSIDTLFVVKYEKTEDPKLQKDLYKKALADYRVAEVQYQKDLEAYKKWKLANEIEMKERELKELKEKLK